MGCFLMALITPSVRNTRWFDFQRLVLDASMSMCLCVLLQYLSNLGGGHWKKFRNHVRSKIGSNVFIVGKFCKECTFNIGDIKIVKHVYM